MKNLLVLLVLLFIVTACSNEPEQSIETTQPIENEVEETPPVEEEEEEVKVEIDPYIAPFSGERSKEQFTSRPVIVTYNNHPKARPQSGIASADIVYEMVAEGNITRILALFQSELPEKMGPVRSARDYFINITKGLDAFYVAHGYSPEALQMLRNGVVDNINGMQYDGTLFRRSSDRVAPHNSYITDDHVIEGMEKVNARTEIEKLPGISFYESEQELSTGEPATLIDVRYGVNEDFHHVYSYDTITQQYNRSSGGIVTIDKESSEDVLLANVLFFEVVHQTIDSVGRQQLDLTSGGTAYLFQSGVMKKIEWQQLDGILTPMDNGQPVKLVPGKSWIHLVKSIDQMVTFTP
ncbi:DUF3048 domain-containing protein [Paenisporosarcina sp. TG20]|uniref:DUF3048 domain-containing protein n=1 Tax=Paenisporosarcina sp. TG20 TaxID=1211706 RepID=UPI0002F9EF08|nr:DUF3048 domain-containing protein [Paenisporosarcina sp. TG20]